MGDIGMASDGHFIWYELTTTDADAAEAFYTSVVGWGTRDASAPGAPYTLFTAGDAAAGGLIGLSADARRMGAQPRWTGYVGVDDVDATVAQLMRLGGTVYVPPTDIPDVSRFAVVADPQRATFALLKWRNPDQQQSAATLPEVVAWHDLLAANAQRAFDFYRELLGWQNADSAGAGGTYQLFAVNGQIIGGITVKPPRTPLPFWLHYFYVADVDAAAARVRAAGGQVFEGPVEAPGGNRIACCVDPQGAMFALSGQGRKKVQGFFAPAAATDPAATRFYTPKKPA
jgi:predicted enzyme related to lactoylglutathione lyase